MTIAKRLHLLIGFVVFEFVGLIYLGISQMDNIFNAADYSDINSVPSLEALGNASDAPIKLRLRSRKYILLKGERLAILLDVERPMPSGEFELMEMLSA